MPKRKRHPKLPTGWGTIRYLGKGRSRPYAVHPPCVEKYENGYYKRPPVLCYVPDWYTGFAVLNAYRAGTYHPGDELSYPPRTMTDAEMDAFCERLLRDRAYTAKLDGIVKELTFKDVYKEWKDWKFGPNAPKKLSQSIQYQNQAAFGHLAPLHDRPFAALRLADLQDAVNRLDLAKGTVEKVTVLLKQIYRYAYAHEYIDRDYTVGLVTPSRREEIHGQPLSDDELKTLWKHRTEEIPRMLLVMCFSGWRIGEVKDLVVDMANKSFTGGSKTAAGKNRIVPIHSGILPYVDSLPKYEIRKMQRLVNRTFKDLKMDHTAHDCRHTFSALCERYGVREADRKRMLGHKVGDITNDTYGHRTLEDLRTEIEKIQFVSICVQ